MTEHNHPEEPFTMDEMKASMMDEDTAESVLSTGMAAIMSLIAGPEHWETMPPLALDLNEARQASRVVRGCPEAFVDRSWLDTQKIVVELTVKALFREFIEWAEENGRSDLLCSAVDLMNAALPAGERVTLD